MIKEPTPDYKRADRKIGGRKFYPVHLTNDDLDSLVKHLLESSELIGKCNIQVMLRKDKGGKGIDFRLDSYYNIEGQLKKDRRYSFGLNANWSTVDFFDHYTVPSNSIKAEIEGHNGVEFVGEEIFRLPPWHFNDVLIGIIMEREKQDLAPTLNPLFQGEEWTCVYRHHNKLQPV